MTAILAVKSKGRVHIGSDRAISLDNGQVIRCGPKSIWVGRYLLAVAGSLGGHWEALQEASPANLRELCDLIGYGPNAEALAAQGPNLWLLSYDKEEERWGACEVSGPVALGSGGLVTLGAYYAVQGTAERRLLRALQITAANVAGVKEPFDVVST